MQRSSVGQPWQQRSSAEHLRFTECTGEMRTEAQAATAQPFAGQHGAAPRLEASTARPDEGELSPGKCHRCRQN